MADDTTASKSVRWCEDCAKARAEAVAAALAPVERLADEWHEEGQSLVRDLHRTDDLSSHIVDAAIEGLQMQRCADGLRAAVAEGKEASRG